MCNEISKQVVSRAPHQTRFRVQLLSIKNLWDDFLHATHNNKNKNKNKNKKREGNTEKWRSACWRFCSWMPEAFRIPISSVYHLHSFLFYLLRNSLFIPLFLDNNPFIKLRSFSSSLSLSLVNLNARLRFLRFPSCWKFDWSFLMVNGLIICRWNGPLRSDSIQKSRAQEQRRPRFVISPNIPHFRIILFNPRCIFKAVHHVCLCDA